MSETVKKLSLTILLVAIGLNVFSQNNWAKFSKATGYGATAALGVDSMNNVYSVTPFQLQVTFEDTMYQAPFPNDGIMVHKYDSAGTKQWDLIMHSEWIPIEKDVMLADDSGNVYLTSVFDSSIVIGDSTFYQNSWAYQDFFICKLNSDGVLQWIHTAEILGDSIDRGCYRTSTHKVDKDGNLYVMCGALYGRPEVHKLYKIDKNGSVKWNMEIQIPTSSPQPNYIPWDVDDEGFIYSAYENYLYKWDSIGNLVWSENTSLISGSILDLDIDQVNNVYISIAEPNTYFIKKFDKKKNNIWSKEQYINIGYMSISKEGNILVWAATGLMLPIVMPDTILPFYIERRDSSGEFMGQITLISEEDSSNYIYKDVFQLMERNGFIYACGSFSGEMGDVVIAGDTTSTTGWNNINFLTKISTSSLDTSQILSVREAISNKLRAKIYPNPFTDNIVLECVSFNASDVEITLYDMTGRRTPSIEKTRISNNKIVLTTSNLAPGFYLLEFRAEGKTNIQKVLKYR